MPDILDVDYDICEELGLDLDSNPNEEQIFSDLVEALLNWYCLITNTKSTLFFKYTSCTSNLGKENYNFLYLLPFLTVTACIY